MRGPEVTSPLRGIGNDVVDLADDESRPESFRPRFDARVFCEAERESIERSPRSLATRWVHWAAKEAGYKLLRQNDPDFVFSPRRLHAIFDDAVSVGETLDQDASTGAQPTGPAYQRVGRLEWVDSDEQDDLDKRNIGISLLSFETEHCVHVVARPAEAVSADERFESGLSVWSTESGAGPHVVAPDASAAVRTFAVQDIARRRGWQQGRATIARRSESTPESAASKSERSGQPNRIPILQLDGNALPDALSLSHHGRWVAYACAAEPAVADEIAENASGTHANRTASGDGDRATIGSNELAWIGEGVCRPRWVMPEALGATA